MPVAVCFHGFLRTGASMWWVSRRLVRAGWLEVRLPTFGYHLRPLESHAADAVRALRALHERHPTEPLDIVTHSFGGVLARAALARHDAPPVRRIVMLSPPNQGAVIAEKFRNLLPVHRIGWDPLAPILPGVPSAQPAPASEVGIIAGGFGHERGANPWLGADNDGTVRVDETHYDGVTDHVVVPVQHSALALSPRVLDLVVRFLQTGRFAPD